MGNQDQLEKHVVGNETKAWSRSSLVMKNAVKFIALEKDFIKNLSSCSASAREPLYYERFIYSNALEC